MGAHTPITELIDETVKAQAVPCSRTVSCPDLLKKINRANGPVAKVAWTRIGAQHFTTGPIFFFPCQFCCRSL